MVHSDLEALTNDFGERHRAKDFGDAGVILLVVSHALGPDAITD